MWEHRGAFPRQDEIHVDLEGWVRIGLGQEDKRGL